MQRAAEQLSGPAQQRFQTGDQLLERERLHQIIVGAAAQPLHPILHAAAGGEHEHRQGILAVADLAQDGEPIVVRQAEIEHQGGVAGGRQRRARLVGSGQHIAVEARFTQAVGQQLGQLLVILDDQQSHRCVPGGCTRDTAKGGGGRGPGHPEDLDITYVRRM